MCCQHSKRLHSLVGAQRRATQQKLASLFCTTILSYYQKMLLCWKCAIDFVVVNNRSKTSANSQSLYISPAVNNFYQNFSGATQGVRPVRMRSYHDFSKYNMAVAAAAYNPSLNSRQFQAASLSNAQHAHLGRHRVVISKN